MVDSDSQSSFDNDSASDSYSSDDGPSNDLYLESINLNQQLVDNAPSHIISNSI